jgi:predicted acyltransferase (DUF342 family)
VVGTLDADTWDQSLSEHTDVPTASQDGKIIADQGGTYGVEAVSTVTQDHVAAENLANIIAQNRSDGDLLAYIGSNSRYEHRSVNDAIQEFADTGIFNDVLVGGVASIRSDTEPTEADWDAELPGRTVPPVPDNVIWVDTDSSGTPTLTFYDSDATAGYQPASYAKGGYWVEKPTGLIDAGLITEGNVEATDIIAEGTITGNQIKSETTITIGTNRQFVIDGINDRFYSTNYNKGQAGIEIDLTNFESQLEGLTVIGELDAGVWDQSLSEHTDASVSSPSDSDVLAHDGTEFVNEGIAALLADHAQIQDLENVADPSTNGQVIADQGGTYAVEAISSLTEDHVTLSDLDKVGISGKADGDVLVETSVGWANEGISKVLGDHAGWSAMQNVSVSSASNKQVAFYDTSASPSRWSPEHIADIIRNRASLSIGDVSVAGSWRTIESDAEPTQRPNGDPLEDGDVWIDTDATPVAEAYVYRNGGFVKQATAIGGNNLVTGSVSAKKIIGDTITANEIKTDTITASVVDTNELFADSGTINDFAASTAMIDEIRNEVFKGNDALVRNVLKVGDQQPQIVIDGQEAQVESSNFTSGISGFRLSADGRAEFEQGVYRGELRATVVKKEEVTATSGQFLIAGATQVVAGDPRNLSGAKPKINSFDRAAGNDIIINWDWEQDALVVREDVADVGERVRFKDGQGGGREEIKRIKSKSTVSNGVQLTFETPLEGQWPEDSVVTRWEERIIHEAQGDFAPFISLVNDEDREFMRMGNLSGLAGLSGHGLSIGNEALTYDAETDSLALEQAEAGPFTIGTQAFNDGKMYMDASKEAFWFDSDTYPDLTLGFGDFDRSSLQTPSEVTSNYLSGADFSDGWQSGWTFGPYYTKVESVEAKDFETNIFYEHRLDPIGKEDYRRDAREFYVDSTGDGTTDKTYNTEVLDKSDQFIRPETVVDKTIASNFVGNKLELKSKFHVGSTFDKSITGFGFEDSSNEPNGAARLEVEGSTEPFSEGNRAGGRVFSQVLDFSGQSSNTFTFEIETEFYDEVGGGHGELNIDVVEEMDGRLVTREAVSYGNRNAGTKTKTLSFDLTIPPSEKLILQVWGTVEGGETGENEGRRAYLDLKDLSIYDAIFNSVLAADGMLWRDAGGAVTMDFDATSGDLSIAGAYYFEGGGRIYKDSNGNIVAEDEAGNTNTLV